MRVWTVSGGVIRGLIVVGVVVGEEAPTVAVALDGFTAFLFFGFLVTFLSFFFTMGTALMGVTPLGDFPIVLTMVKDMCVGWQAMIVVKLFGMEMGTVA
jgi:hypothetical protein